MSDCFHLTLGYCRYGDFKPGDSVELSMWGWEAGLSTNYAYTFGRVAKFDKGVLTVLREGMDRSQDFHPCYWIRITKEDVEELRKEERRCYWADQFNE